jgi:hypothetical protein
MVAMKNDNNVKWLASKETVVIDVATWRLQKANQIDGAYLRYRLIQAQGFHPPLWALFQAGHLLQTNWFGSHMFMLTAYTNTENFKF